MPFETTGINTTANPVDATPLTGQIAIPMTSAMPTNDALTVNNVREAVNALRNAPVPLPIRDELVSPTPPREPRITVNAVMLDRYCEKYAIVKHNDRGQVMNIMLLAEYGNQPFMIDDNQAKKLRDMLNSLNLR